MASLFYNCSVCAYNAAADLASKYVKPETIDAYQHKIINTDMSRIGKVSMFCGLALACWGSPVIGACLGFAGYALSRGRSETIQFFLDAADRGIDRIVQASKMNDSPRSMLAFRSTHDENGFLASRLEIDRYAHFAQRCRIHLVRANTKAEYQGQLQSIQEKYDIALYDCHALPSACILSEQMMFSKNSQKSIEWLKARVKEGGIIILQGCNTGSGEDCIARAISQACPNVFVYAAEDVLYSTNISYDDDCVPTFTTQGFEFVPDPIHMRMDVSPFKRSITRKFLNGRVMLDV